MSSLFRPPPRLLSTNDAMHHIDEGHIERAMADWPGLVRDFLLSSSHAVALSAPRPSPWPTPGDAVTAPSVIFSVRFRRHFLMPLQRRRRRAWGRYSTRSETSRLLRPSYRSSGGYGATCVFLRHPVEASRRHK